MQQPLSDRLATALAAVANPAAHGGHPALIAAAWADLKAARGQTCDLARLQPAYLIDRPDPLTGLDAALPSRVVIDDLMAERARQEARIRQRVRNRAAILRGCSPEGGAA